MSLNTSDLVEAMPGAQPSANPVQKARFNERCRQMWEEEKEEKQHQKSAHELEQAEGLDKKVNTLMDMFIISDRSLVTNLLLEREGDLEKTAEVLMGLTEGAGSSGAAGSSSCQPAEDDEDLDGFEVLDPISKSLKSSSCSPPSSSHNLKRNGNQQKKNSVNNGPGNLNFKNNKDFPVMTDKDGWQVPNFTALKQEDSLEAMQESPRDWAKMADRAKDLVAMKPVVKKRKSGDNQIPAGVKIEGSGSVSPEKSSPKKEAQNLAHPDQDNDVMEGIDDFEIRRELHSQKRGKKKFGSKNPLDKDISFKGSPRARSSSQMSGIEEDAG